MIKKDLRLALSAREQESIEVKLSYAGPLIAPVKAGAPIGTVRFLMEGKAIAEVQVETANDVAAVEFNLEPRHGQPADPGAWRLGCLEHSSPLRAVKELGNPLN